jgi:4-hydroxy-3-methylbut-2-enyl diphosphate reductase
MDDTAKVIDALRARFPGLRGPRKDDICYATQNRQDAVKDMVGKVQVLLVVGSQNSSNSNRLRELAEREGVAAFLIDGADDIRREWVEGAKAIGVTAGASAPEVLVREVVARLESWGAVLGEPMRGREENVTFSLPRDLIRKSREVAE